MITVGWFAGRTWDVPGDDTWLGEQERATLNHLHVPKRHDDWRVGRWVAKNAVRAWLLRGTSTAPSLSTFQILPAPDGAPEVEGLNGPVPAVSLSHSAGLAVAAVAASEVALGIDVELVEPRSNEFVEDCFTTREIGHIRRSSPGERNSTVSLMWSAKESALKALRVGLRADTREVEVDLLGPHGHQPLGGWSPLSVELAPSLCAKTGRFHGWWQRMGHHVVTLVTEPTPALPSLLQTQ